MVVVFCLEGTLERQSSGCVLATGGSGGKEPRSGALMRLYRYGIIKEGLIHTLGVVSTAAQGVSR